MSYTCKTGLFAVLMLSALLITGCNAFEGFTHSFENSDSEGRMNEASLELDSANYEKARELYDLLIEDGHDGDEIRRGRAAALAGLAGFNMFSVLNTMQNDPTVPADTSTVIFKAALAISDKSLLSAAISDMNLLSAPSESDYVFRGLMVPVMASLQVWEKYDTNLNSRLDTPDQIDFDTNDDITLAWSGFYASLGSSLEKSVSELGRGLSGRGDTWNFIMPISGTSFSGEYTTANRKLISAVCDFCETLKEANTSYVNNAESAFKTTLLSLDGE